MATNNYDLQRGIQINIDFSNMKSTDESDTIANVKGIDKVTSINSMSVYGITPKIQEAYCKEAKKNIRNIFYELNGQNKSANTEVKLADDVFYINDLLKYFSECKVRNNDKIHKMFKYGFDGSVSYNSDTHLIEEVTFTFFKNLVY